jgi:hypothetical protein
MQNVVSVAISLGCKDDSAWELLLTRRTVSRTWNRLVTQRLVDSSYRQGLLSLIILFLSNIKILSFINERSVNSPYNQRLFSLSILFLLNKYENPFLDVLFCG